MLVIRFRKRFGWRCFDVGRLPFLLVIYLTVKDSAAIAYTLSRPVQCCTLVWVINKQPSSVLLLVQFESCQFTWFIGIARRFFLSSFLLKACS